MAALFDDYIYARYSQDDLGDEKSVARQLKSARLKSAADGGHVVAEFSDNDISALRGATRPGFDKLMAAITAPNPHRRKRRIVLLHTSRLWRNRVERAIGIDTLGRVKVTIAPINGPTLDLSTAAGRMLAGLVGETDTGESETKGERIADVARERAYEGRANGRVLYGWKREYEYDSRGKVIGFHDLIHPVESQIVQEIIARVIAGESLLAITKNLNERNITAPRANDRRKKKRAIDVDKDALRQWDRSSVKFLALRPANIAQRIYHRGKDDEVMLDAAWPAIVSVADHELVESILRDPARNRIERPGARQYLLTWGIGACGVCGMRLRSGRISHRDQEKKLLYVCAENQCIGRNMQRVDDVVTEVMVRLLSRDDAVGMLDDHSVELAAAIKDLTGLRARLAKASERYAEGHIDDGQLADITARMKPGIAAAEARVEQYRTTPYLKLALSVVGGQARERWEALAVTQRRAVMDAFGVQVFVDRQGRGAKFNPRSVRIEPRGAARALVG